MNAANPNADPPGNSKRQWRWSFIVERGVALALALLLLRSAFAHLGNSYHFLSTIYSYQITSPEIGKWLAILLPYWQMAAAVCLLARWWIRATYLLLAMTFVLFVTAQALVLLRGIEISCGCFGSSDSVLVGRATLAVALGCAVAALLGGLLARFSDRVGQRPVAPGASP